MLYHRLRSVTAPGALNVVRCEEYDALALMGRPDCDMCACPQIPGYQLGNFLLCSMMYVGVSHRLFTLTNTLKDAFVPHSDNAALARNAALMALALGLLYVGGVTLHLFAYQTL
jgi:hypothetical protein